MALYAVLAFLIGYRVMTAEKPKTVPLIYTRGAVATSPVRMGVQSPAAGSDPLLVFLVQREKKFPGVTRDIFRMENPAPKTKPAPVTAPAPTVPAPPPVPVKTPEEIAADAARADLSRFRFLGYLTDKDSTLFLSKDGELYIVRSGDTVLKNYRVKEAGKDHVVLLDSMTRVEVRIELSGGADQAPPQQRLR
jgi:hypothetical protein